MKLLLIENDRKTIETLKDELEKNYIVETSSTGDEGEYKAQINKYDLIILDLGLPDQNGRLVCKKIRENSKVPILILTGEYSLKIKVSLFDIGADDYVVKPFTFDELKARIRALLRRNQQVLCSQALSVRDLTLDLDKKTVKRGAKVISLRRKEFYLLEYLMRNAGNVVSRGMIFDHAWDSNSDALTNIVDVHIKYLRDQVDKPFDDKLIKTIYGLGYKIEA